MVSKASEDLPEPDRPVITTSLSRGMSTSMFLRLCTRAPRTAIHLRGIGTDHYINSGLVSHRRDTKTQRINLPTRNATLRLRDPCVVTLSIMGWLGASRRTHHDPAA